MSVPSLLRRAIRPSPSSLIRLPRPFSTTCRAREEVKENVVQATDAETAIRAKLTELLKPSRLDIEDVSGGCGTFFAITVQSSAFTGLPTIKQHRLVNQALKDDIAGIHGLQLKTIPDTPSS